ncbi:HIG1 domain member 2A [Coemansia erecta]|nr:HIG1 domain member 2A [Coemansia sp. RSA 2618]KAJ2820584.1 HIG1 domain member 2A [Coemansia erecta]
MFGDSRFIRKLKEEPLVPLGAGATICALVYAAWGIQRNNTKQAQRGMRGRVIMQGLTICALLGYGLLKTRNSAHADKSDIRPINWERLEHEAQQAEAGGSNVKGRPTTPALEKIVARANEEKAKEEKKSIFAKSIFVQETAEEPKK